VVIIDRYWYTIPLCPGNPLRCWTKALRLLRIYQRQGGQLIRIYGTPLN
jgi:hypothetical protein